MRYGRGCLTGIVLVLFSGIIIPSGAQDYNIDEEISRIRKELKQVQNERERVKKETRKDRKDFAKYVERQQKRFSSIKAETDSIRADIREAQATSDSLAAQLASVQASKRQYELLQDRFRNRLIEGCDRFLTISDHMPPMAKKTLSPSLSYLRSEMVSKAIDNIEGINRLAQIVKDLNEATMAIQIMQGQPPVTELQGITHSLRIGGIFQAAADAKETYAAQWTGYDDEGNPQWKVIKDPELAANIREAVNIREGKALPDFVALPFGEMKAQDVQQQAVVENEGEEQ
ncbi:MAG: DUF3450 family protein [Chitinivibrionales bacterium]|nr:DUF3450 family protein [Chitinivibrionales bacterium]